MKGGNRRNFSIEYPYNFIVLLVCFIALTAGCKHKPTPQIDTVFQVLDSKTTGLDFANVLTPTKDLNLFNYMYYYNGAGIGAGDFNNDGLTDLFFAANQGQNKLYINRGNLQFKDVTSEARIPNDSAWSTGVSVVDINNDGLLDIYVCIVSGFEGLKGTNKLLVCKGINKNGVPFYEDEAAMYGLNFSGFCTQAAFFDFDQDGDLDMFLLNHPVNHDGNFVERFRFQNTYDSLAGQRLYRNDDGKFTNITKQACINGSRIGYGLGVCVSDINLDGWPDLYVGNDFHENDYLYINQKNGSFKDELNESMMHTSQFTMGVDVADINNDAWPDVVSMDMLPADPYILKRSLGEDDYNVYNMKLKYGYSPQYARNNLQLNDGNGHFSEIGRYAGIYATDWSWAALWMDFDNDGFKDLFISNGIPKRLNDIDYISFVSGEEMKRKVQYRHVTNEDMQVVNKFPEIKLPNKFYRNNGAAKFEDMAAAIAGDRPTYSNGAVYADFDNDGDLDVVVNNITDPVLVYQNKSNDKENKPFLKVVLKGSPKNVNATGAKLMVYANGHVHTYEKSPVRGFQSSMETPLLIGLDKLKIDSLKLIWPDNTCQLIEWKKGLTQLNITYAAKLPLFDYNALRTYNKPSSKPVQDITAATNLLYQHKENNFVEFDREPLMPHMASQEGPALAVADINGDGMEDVFVGSSRGFKGAIFIQQQQGRFIKTPQHAIDMDSNFEDVAACWADVNNDGFNDLVVASGGNEYFGPDSFNTPRVYINDGKANFTKLPHAFNHLFLTASCVVPYDFNGDGFIDLFIGARAVSFDYGKKPTSYLLQNDGSGRFKDVTNVYSKELGDAGFVTNAVWFDLDKDGDEDLVLSCEWDGICAYINNKNSFTKKQLTDKNGWWNFVLPVDIDNDGDVDLVAGNLGLNSRLTASPEQPVRMYYYDFDGNGKKEQILTYYLQNREIPFANKGEIEKQLPGMKKQFLYAEDFAKASLAKLFSNEKLDKADLLTANYFSNALLINDGKLNFTVKALPWQAQLSCYKTAVVINANNDNLPDILLGGNFYANNIQIGRYDGDYGTILINRGKDSFTCENLNGVVVKGEVRHIGQIKIDGQEAFIMAKNNDSLQVIIFRK
ncbi:VCBS repeat-containing protein [soil metagenome]